MATHTLDNLKTRAAIGVVAVAFLLTVFGRPVTAAKPLSPIDERGKFDLRHAHFEDVATYIQEKFNVPVRFDRAALDELGISLDKKGDFKTYREGRLAARKSFEERLKAMDLQPAEYQELLDKIEQIPYPGIEFVADDISLHAALVQILREQNPDLSYRLHDGAIEITTQDVVQQNLETRIFKVEDLVTIPLLEVEGPFDPMPEKDRVTSIYDYDPLIEIITTTIDPDSWEEAGGSGRVAEGDRTLVVSHTPRHLRRVEQMIAALREIRARKKDGDQLQPIRLEDSPQAAAAREHLEQALNRSLEMNYADTSLAEMIEDLAERLSVPIRLDESALDELGIGEDSPISFTQEETPVRQALQRALAQIDPELTLLNRDEVLLVTTREVVSERPAVVLYPVFDLVETLPLEKSEVTTPNGSQWDTDYLIEAIVGTVSPDFWEEAGGAGRIAVDDVHGILVVSQTDEIHSATSALLSEFRQIAAERAESDQAKQKEEAETDDDFVKVVYFLWQPHDESTHVEEEDLVELIQEEVAPDSWEGEEVSVRTLPSRLIIRQRKSVHREIYQVLVGLQVLKPVAQGEAGFSTEAATGGYGGGGFGGGGQGGAGFGGGFGKFDGAKGGLGSAGQLPPAENGEGEADGDDGADLGGF